MTSNPNQGEAVSTTRSPKEVERELEKMERFRKVAGRRANRALDYMEMLLRTSDRGRYAYTDEQVTEILAKLNQATDQLAAAYAGQRAARIRVDL
jgi:rRNA-processing protein FCF1